MSPKMPILASRPMLEISGCLLALVVFSFAPALMAQDRECGWLETNRLDQAFPQYAPWQLVTGGQVGSCRFRSRSDRPPNLFSANQMVHASEQAAVDFIANLRSELAASYEIIAAPDMGAQGFFYLPSDRSGAAADRTLSFAGHQGRVTAIGNLALQEPVSQRLREAGLELMLAALSIADDSEALAAASDCRWFNPGVLERLLPAGGITQNVMGENSCFATDSANRVLTVSVHRATRAMVNRQPSDCEIEGLPELGEYAYLAYACTGGRPRATVQLLVEEMVVSYNLAPGEEPSPDQRQALIEQARWALAGSASL